MSTMLALLYTHVAFMTLSIIVTSGTLAFSVFGKNVSSAFIRVNLLVTIIGLISGTALLFTKPLGIQCVVLGTYLILFTLAHRFVLNSQQKLATQ